MNTINDYILMVQTGSQFVDEKDNKDFINYQNIKKKKFGVVLNASFNHGRAMVRTPQDAIDDFLDLQIDRII